MALNLQHQTAAEFAARFWTALRSAYKAGDKLRFCRLLYWLERRLIAGDITDAGARTTYNNVFGKALTAGQWTTLRAGRIKPSHDRYAAILAESEL